MTTLKKAIAISATAAMILTGLGSAFLAGAVTIADGDLVKLATAPGIYLIQGATKRVFPHYNVYLSWNYPIDFSTVKVVSASELAAYSDGNSVPFRDGSLFRGTAASLGGKEASAVFYVEGATLRPVYSSDVYQTLFKDASWSKVTWVPDDLLTKFNYPMGSILQSSSVHPDGSLVKYSGETQVYLVKDGKKRAISTEAMTANRYKAGQVVEILSGEVYTAGDSITGVESGLITVGWTGTAVAAGALSASLYQTPAAATLPLKATNLPLLKVKLQAGASDVSVSGLIFKRTGIGNASEFSGLYLYLDDVRITPTARTLATDTHEVEFAALSIAVSANGYKILELRGDLNEALAADGGAVQGNQHTLQLKTISTTATVSGLPLSGNQMAVGGVIVGGVTHSKGTAPSNPNVGAKAAEIYTFKIQGDGSHEVSFSQVVLTKGGSIASSAVTNIKLYDSANTLLASASGIASNDTVTLTLSTPYTVGKGLTKSFAVKADLGGKREETVKIKIDETSHLVVTDLYFGYGARIAGSVLTDTTVTMQGGDVTLAFNGPSVGDIAQNTNDVVLMKFSMTPVRAIDVKKLKVTLTLSGVVDQPTEIDFKDLRIKDENTGATLMGPYDWAFGIEDAPIVKSFTDSFTISAGVIKNLVVTIDTDDNVPDGVKIKAKVEGLCGDVGPTGDGDGAVETGENECYIKDVDSNLYVKEANLVPTSVTGYDMTAKVASLTVSRAAVPVSTTVVKGKLLVESLGAELSASTASAITVRKIVARIYGETDATAKTYVSIVKLYDGATLLGSANLVDATTYSTLTYDNLNVSIPAAGSKKLVFKADIKSDSPSKYYYVDLDRDDITAYDANGNDRTPTGEVINLAGIVKITISAAGTLTAVKDAGSPVAGILVTSTDVNNPSNPEISKIKFEATKEDFTISKLRVVLGSSTSSRDVLKVSIDSGVVVEKDMLSTGVADFTGLSIVVPKDSSKIITIKAKLNTIANGAVSGDKIKIGIDYDTNFEAKGESGETKTDFGSPDEYGEEMVLRKTKPTVSVVALGASTFTPGADTEIGRIKIAADAAENIDLDGLKFTIETNDATWKATNLCPAKDNCKFKLYDSTSPSVELINHANMTSAAYVTSTGILTLDWATLTRLEIAKAGEKTLILKANTVGIGDGLGTGVDATIGANVTADASEGATGNLVWYDKVTDGAAINGYQVLNLPVSGYTTRYDR